MRPKYIAPTLTFLIFRLTGSVAQSSPVRFITELTALIKQSLDANAYFRRGGAYTKKSDYNNAIKEFTTAIALGPDFTDAYRKRGQAYHDKRDYKRAVADFTKLIQLQPDEANAYALRGRAYLKKGSYYRAVFDFTDAIIVPQPDYTDAYAWRARAGLPAKG